MKTIKINDHEIEIYDPVPKELFFKVLSYMTYRPLAIYRDRGNVGSGRTACFGLVGTRSGLIKESRQNQKHPEFFEMLKELARHLPVPKDWTSVQVNQDYATFPHKDKGNVGKSCIVSCGFYGGGELEIESSETIDTNCVPVVADFCALEHRVKPLSGLKLSFVFFKLPQTIQKRVRSKNVSKEVVEKCTDKNHLFNPVPAVVMRGKVRSYITEQVYVPFWSGLQNKELVFLDNPKNEIVVLSEDFPNNQ